ncbi:MAG: DUF2784 domain-containing protein [Bacteroidales bacterium]|nr:DUF2784 domain-containing protein [Bacteroidales bacterium]
MVYNFLSNLVVFLHLLFILFVCLGAFLVIKWPRIVWIHIPFALWGIVVEYFNMLCPLTPLENYFRKMSGGNTYETDFIERYIVPLIYPETLTRNLQFVLGSIVIVLNFAIYGFILYKRIKKRSKSVSKKSGT